MHGLATILTEVEHLKNNILVIVADDMSQRDLAMYADTFPNPTPPPTPHLDRLADAGVRFTRVHANPTCSSTRATLLTGSYAFRTGIGSNVLQALAFDLSPEHTTFAAVLRSHGYRTACLGKWHLSTSYDGYAHLAPHEHGFDEFLAGSTTGGLQGEPPYHNWKRTDNGVVTTEPGYATRVQGEAARDWVFGGSTQEPWCAFLTFNAPHGPFHVPPADMLPAGYPEPRDLRGKYEAMIVAMDHALGDVLDHVDFERTVIFFLSDNGTPTYVAHPLQDPDKVKGTLYRESVEVPFLMAGARVGHGVCHALANTTDLFATICDAAEVPVPAGVAPDSRSLWAHAQDPELPSSRPWALSQRFKPNGLDEPTVMNLRALVDERYKLMRVGGEESFFDLVADPTEDHDLLSGPMSPHALAAYEKLSRKLSAMVWDTDVGVGPGDPG